MKKKFLLGCILLLCCWCSIATSGIVLIVANLGTIFESIPEKYGVEQDTSRFVKVKDVIPMEAELNASIQTKLDELVEKAKNNEPLTISYTEAELTNFMNQYLKISNYKDMPGLGIDITDNRFEMILPFQDIKSLLDSETASDPIITWILDHSPKLYIIVSLKTQNGKIVVDNVTFGSPRLDRGLSEKLKKELQDYIADSFDSIFESQGVIRLKSIEFKDNQMSLTYELI